MIVAFLLKKFLSEQSSFSLLYRLWSKQVKPYRLLLLGAVISMSIVAAMTALTSWLLKDVVDKIFVNKDNEMLWYIGGAVVGVFLVKSMASYIGDILLAYAGQHIVSDLQNTLFSRLIDQDLALFQSYNSGTLISHFTFDINAMRSAVSSTLVGFGRDFLSIIFLVTVIFIQDWRLACLSLLIAPISIYPIQRISQKMRRTARQTQEQMGNLTTNLSESFQGIRIIKAYLLEDFEKNRLRQVTQFISKLTLQSVKAEAAAQPIIDSFGGFAIAAVIVYGGHQVMTGYTTAGAFFSFIAATLMAYQPLRSLSKINISMQTGLAAAQRVFAVLDREIEVTEKNNPQYLPREAGDISFHAVSFRYRETETSISDNKAISSLNLWAPAGKVTALVGSSGAGKSTILNMIPRFYDPQEGSILVNGHDIKDVTLVSLREAIALVSQEIILFDDTIANNIRCGRLNASDDDVVKAAQAAAAYPFIQDLPEGFQTRVGEDGLRLSGGQRQRIAIARALLKNAPILLLDEATSALDTESERHIQDALSQLMKGRTTIVIAHRLSTIQNADLIHVLDQGTVIETGTHSELLEKNGRYTRLYELQFHQEI